MDHVKEAEKLKEEGNKAFAAKDFKKAIQKFTEALSHDPRNHAYYSNRSAAYLSLGKEVKDNDKENYQKAVEDGDKCIELNSDWDKGYSRKGAALVQMKEFAKAVQCYALGLAKDPSSRLLLDGLSAAQKNVKEQTEAEEDKKEDYVIGIDLGTTYSAVAVWKGKGIVMIPNDRGDNTTASIVAFTNSGKRMIGAAAKSQQSKNPTNTLYDVKRFIGQRYEDPGVSQDISRMTYKIISSDGDGKGKPIIEVDMGMHGKKQFAAEEISAMVLGYLKKTAETFLGQPVTKAVITVPAYFNDAQRAATKAAGKIAGLEVLRIINEPTAAALAYGLDKQAEKKPLNVLIFDLGGGTFDVSVLRIEGGIFEVKATGGDTRLGGEDFDTNIVDFLVKEAEKMGLPDFTGDPVAVKRLRVAAEKSKRLLSQAQSADVVVEGIVKLERSGSVVKSHDFKFNLTRQQFDKLNLAFFTKCLETVKHVLKDAKMKPADINEIVLMGGSTRIVKIQEMLSEFFGGKDLCRTINPDEGVAFGAGVQAAILSGHRNKQTENLLLMDVTPLSLGIETTGKVMSVIIPRNTRIPCVKTQTYTTEENYQTQVDVCVFEGERTKTDQNNFLGKFTISGIEKAKRGEPKVDVSFSLDSNGILNVTAKDQKTGAEAHIEITSRSRASDADVERMVREAEHFKKDDEAQIKKIEALNELEGEIYRVMTLSTEIEDRKAAIQLEQAATEIQTWLDDKGDEANASELRMKRKTLDFKVTKITRS